MRVMQRPASTSSRARARGVVCPSSKSTATVAFLSALAPLIVAQSASADLSSFEELSTRTYDAEISRALPKRVASNTSRAAQSNSPTNLSLLGGLTAGIAASGVGLSVIRSRRNEGPKIQNVAPSRALEIFEEDMTAQLLDVRPKAAIKEAGSPDLRSVKRSPICLPYSPSASDDGKPQTGTVTLGWPERVTRMSKIKEADIVVILDEDGSTAAAAAAELAGADPKRIGPIYCVSGGAAAWIENELPWKEPLRLGLVLETLKAVDLSGVSAGAEKLVEKYSENPSIVNGVVATAAVAGASLFLFSELEAILQVVGVVYALQFLARRLVFAEDRARTFSDIKRLIQDKIAAGEAGDDLRRLADTVLDVDSAEAMAVRAAESVPSASPGLDSNGAKPANVLEARAWIEAWRASNKVESYPVQL